MMPDHDDVDLTADEVERLYAIEMEEDPLPCWEDWELDIADQHEGRNVGPAFWSIMDGDADAWMRLAHERGERCVRLRALDAPQIIRKQAAALAAKARAAAWWHLYVAAQAALDEELER